ncbi:hypothetical protein HBI63_207100 [Parastagonospora nodorum]|nr:hypothetical protein HBI74_182550 [Parastagonospora nodorum]KAH5673422.1 hypothetical protein HBI21_153330 [Parastagonospora nodorum]KAH6140277.1 hypothetical protein HBI63_207100 [Parastagonospora nodorum]KAH6172222.1 hypothetical protein HBI61_176920 [Parastagonospora nodorum]
MVYLQQLGGSPLDLSLCPKPRWVSNSDIWALGSFHDVRVHRVHTVRAHSILSFRWRLVSLDCHLGTNALCSRLGKTSLESPRICAHYYESYSCGMINMFSWVAITSGVAIIFPQGLLAIVTHYNSMYQLQAWHVFLVYQGVNILCLLHNVFTINRTMWVFNAIFALSLVAFLSATVTCWARAPTHQSHKSVWTDFVNMSGWEEEGVVFLIGTLTPGYMYAGIDGAIHLAEEAANATEAVPRALLCTWLIGFVTSFIIAVTAMYTTQDFSAVASTVTGFPVFELFNQAMRSDVAAAVFVSFLVVAAAAAAVAGCQQTASRLTWAFARDSGLIASSTLSRMSVRRRVPVAALCTNSVVVAIIGCLYLGSSTAFNAFIGTGLILQLITFAIPAALLLLQRRPARLLPKTRTFGLPRISGWIANFFTVGFALVCLVFYDLPAILPTTASNMNYSPAVIGIVCILMALNWVFWARKHFNGPRLANLE